ncbi:MAG TPA: SDR family NAD(P)-dependent oxidoreductase [Candidatus Baltobacteraceae bacterium]|nr:SDR family NAD(P)-dependent oxidoreductase [Candidatus Baltobacteraceae bacterium]
MSSGTILENKVALVTGASRGIGFAIARGLAGLGAKVALCARDPQRLEKAAAQLKDSGASVAAIPADLRSANEIAPLVRKAEESLGPLDILVNNAGIGTFAPVQEASEADWDAILDTNLKAVFLLTKAVAPGMIQRRTGHIINIGSLSGRSAFAGGGIYCASKWGLLGFTQCAAEDLRQYGIRVSAVMPGSVATDFSPHAGKDTSKMLQPEDVAHAVESIVTQAPQSFISEVLIRPAQKP